MPDAFTSLGPILHIPIIAGITAVALAALVVFIILNRRADKKQTWRGTADWEMSIFFSAIFAFFGLLCTAIMLIPYDAKYHHIYALTGTVSSVTNTFTDASGEISTNPVVEFEEHDFVAALSDSRAVTLEGREVDLTCTIEFVYYGADRYNCDIAAVR